MMHTDVVYKIEYKDCVLYVDQREDSQKELANIETISIETQTKNQEYRLEQHDFDWDNVKMLDQEKILNKRLISEMIFIHKQKNSLNI